MSKRSRRKSTMRGKDEGFTGGTWLSGWGKDLPKMQRIARARRKRAARREAEEAR